MLTLALAYFRRRWLLALSALCLALGVGVLFAVLSILNGFLHELEMTLRDFSGDLTVSTRGLAVESARSEDFLQILQRHEQVSIAAPRINWFGLVGRRGARAVADPRSSDLSGLLLVGLEPALEEGTGLAAGLSREELNAALDPDSGPESGLALGAIAAEKLGVEVGDSLEVVSFYNDGKAEGPRVIRLSFRVRALFDTGQYEQNLDRALVHRSVLTGVTGLGSDFSELVIWCSADTDLDLFAGRLNRALASAGLALEGAEPVQTWRRHRSNLLAAVEDQRGLLGFVFFFIVLVAAYQLFATLTLTVAEKRRDIGVLGALGASPRRIIAFFVMLALVTSATGLGLGLALGFWIMKNIAWIEGVVGGEEGIFRPEVYQFDEIPTAVDPLSVLALVGATLAAALVFSWIPAWRASRTPIARALNSNNL